MKIFIDAGHNYSGIGTGAVGNGLKEQDINFYIADKLKKLFVASGHKVKMSREKLTDNMGGTLTESLKKRATMANEWGADLFVSIHCNAFNGKAKGTECLIYSSKSKSFETAKEIQKAIVKSLGTVDRGIKERPDLAVLRHTKAPAILVETAFIDNPEDALLLKNRQDDFARAIYKGITGESYNEPSCDTSDINEIAKALYDLGIVEDKDGLIKEMSKDPDGRLYWLARKSLKYIRSIKK